VTRSRAGVDLAVVIPALAEKASLFKTLASLAAHSPAELATTLVIAVINNHPYPLAQARQIQNNQETLRILEKLAQEAKGLEGSFPRLLQEDCRRIIGSGLRVALIDASSPGREIPERDGGVGTARKAGMDAALEVLSLTGGDGVISCLDADTPVQDNYLTALRNHFRFRRDSGAVVEYAHRIPKNPKMAEAICCYEIFLRYYVSGLAYAGSPYAFPTIGSTMACTAKAYRTVRGMNRRPAAEDFHFLNKLAKIGTISLIRDTTVFPSGRSSRRVPFGTGCRIRRHLRGEVEAYRLYDPVCFRILQEWLVLMASESGAETPTLLGEAAHIHPELARYLLNAGFAQAWPLIRKNAADSRQRFRQFHIWFDGLKTMKLIRHLSGASHPPLPMFTALKGLSALMDRPCPLPMPEEGAPPLAVLRRILERMRSRYFS